jgi:glycosyltransferase involved in cell wall biosynthesis
MNQQKIEKPRLIYVVADGAPGGGTTHVLQLMEHFRIKFDVLLLTQPKSYLYFQAQKMEIDCLEIDFFDKKRFFKNILFLRGVYEKNPTCLLHVHGGRAAFFTLISRIKNFIYTVHGLHHIHKPKFQRFFGLLAEKFIFKNCRKIIFVSKFDQNFAVNQKITQSTAHILIYNGIKKIQENTQDIAPKWDVGFIGRFEHQKDPLLFVDTIAQLQNVAAVMVGDGELRTEVQQKIHDLRLKDRITILGALSQIDTLEVLRQIKVLSMTSRWEGLPITLLEAMASQVPIVATNVGGIPEVLGQNGGLLVERDAQDLAAAIRGILENQDLRRRLIAEGQMRQRELFSERSMLMKLEEVYNQWHADQ